jgi:hypothetical protein
MNALDELPGTKKFSRKFLVTKKLRKTKVGGRRLMFR